MVDVKKLLWKNDRDFNKDEINDQRYFLVAEHNDLITKARHDLNARELKIMDYVISKIKPDDKNFNIIQTSMYELSNVLELKRSGRTYSQLAQNLNDMRAKSVRIYNEVERSITMTGWFERAKVWENGKIELKINEDFAPFLLRLKDNGHYTQYLLHDTVQLKSKYAILLYKLMRESDKDNGQSIPIVQGTPDDFKKWLGAPKNYAYKDLKKSVLIRSIEEINMKIDDMDLELFQAKRGRQVVQVEIHNNFARRSSTKDL
ncbi:protein RepB [Lacticaseibacillus paracasei subsp. paracasei Lpp70]|uniref:Protein RepB n=1 Tax=Lacticaseibacillus paracasei subsp. paracasei Lpp7 TaxID=1256200 RepID=A0A8E0M7W2_LACPA|nr:protein RepB [Lacticaseibacillus paracasei subsp. paracasei Lpp7]EPD06917.1 protein RepB [Lacticaseibacillus paracasei subsp. paracasei Lpp70]